MRLLIILHTKPCTKFEVSSSSSFGDMFDHMPSTGSVGQPGDDDGPVCCLRQGPSAADGRMYHAYACVAAVQRDTWLFDCSAMNAVIQLNITRHKFVLTNCASILYSITATTRRSTESTKLTIRGFTRLLTALYTVVHSKRTVAVPLCH